MKGYRRRRVVTTTNCPHRGRYICKELRAKASKWQKVPELGDLVGSYNI
jgi:hypothetical protein